MRTVRVPFSPAGSKPGLFGMIFEAAANRSASKQCRSLKLFGRSWGRYGRSQSFPVAVMVLGVNQLIRELYQTWLRVADDSFII